MANYSTLGQIAGQPDFQNRVAIAMNVAATAIYTESTSTSTITINHAARATFATKVVAGSYNLQATCMAVLVNSTIQGEATSNSAGNGIPDTDIQFQVNSIWNCLAGA